MFRKKPFLEGDIASPPDKGDLRVLPSEILSQQYAQTIYETRCINLLLNRIEKYEKQLDKSITHFEHRRWAYFDVDLILVCDIKFG